MSTRRQFRVWNVALALLVIGLLAAFPVFADPGLRLGPPDDPATGYAPYSARAPAALPATGLLSSTWPYHTVAELRRVEDQLAPPVGLPATGAQPVRPYHTMFELHQLEASLAR